LMCAARLSSRGWRRRPTPRCASPSQRWHVLSDASCCWTWTIRGLDVRWFVLSADGDDGRRRRRWPTAWHGWSTLMASSSHLMVEINFCMKEFIYEQHLLGSFDVGL
jgi:hypothetical protein